MLTSEYHSEIKLLFVPMSLNNRSTEYKNSRSTLFVHWVETEGNEHLSEKIHKERRETNLTLERNTSFTKKSLNE